MGVTGASGVVYAVELLRVLAERGVDVELCVSSVAGRILEWGCGLGLGQLARYAVRVYGEGDLAAPPASGTARLDGVVIVPCSMKTVAAVAHGYAANLIARVADVALKEGWRLILVPRETPLSLIHLRNLVRLVEAGAVVLPASPGFYHRPEGVGDLVRFVVARILDQLGLEHDLMEPWRPPDGGEGAPSKD